ncbi:MAG: tRNA preQ1(34) S-adenosylmethionine ribosyltransferase-isomerase QueA [Pseudomonadota bacterium]|nr:tRNA preQ1(34) S-adenosylmethionine ribosyltransferase-isomerase QueA [Pseudomonadota bacterium]
MNLSDFDFELPEELIATRPVSPRSTARLLVAKGDNVDDGFVNDLPEFLRSGDRLVFNDTKVLPARLNGFRSRDIDVNNVAVAKIEVTLLASKKESIWSALIKPLRKIRVGEKITFDKSFEAILIDKVDGQGILHFNKENIDFLDRLEELGVMPLPPYIASKRQADERDNLDYQTIFAEKIGSVAAPTASLHFDLGLLEKLKKKGVETSFVTLHVGAGTFLPVKSEDIRQHKMHAEFGEINQKTVDEIRQTKKNGGRIIPVGTTALRLLETAAQSNDILSEWRGETDIFIYPGYKFIVADGLMTNFHLPKSTLMMLVSALMGKETIESIYNHAITKKYRFFSYGDSSLLFP